METDIKRLVLRRKREADNDFLNHAQILSFLNTMLNISSFQAFLKKIIKFKSKKAAIQREGWTGTLFIVTNKGVKCIWTYDFPSIPHGCKE